MESSYDFEIEKVIDEIKRIKAEKVCLQFPDGMKPFAGEVVDQIEQETGIRPIIWLGSCFGACDIPLGIKDDVDLLVQFGHNTFVKNPTGWRKSK